MKVVYLAYIVFLDKNNRILNFLFAYTVFLWSDSVLSFIEYSILCVPICLHNR